MTECVLKISACSSLILIFTWNEKITARLSYVLTVRRIFISTVNLKRDVFDVLDVCIGFITCITTLSAVYLDVCESVDITEKNTANTSNTPLFNFSCKIKFDFDV